MSTAKQLWLLTGGNGVGKTTFYQRYLQPLGMPFVNADNIAKELFPESPEMYSYEAALIAQELRYDLLQKGQSFCFETVFSHPTKIDFIAKAKALGYEIIIVIIHLDSPQLNKARVAQRVALGGHNVPEDKVESRIPRVLQNLKTAIPLCDHVRILDNSLFEDPYAPILTIRNGNVAPQKKPLPDWAKFICGIHEDNRATA